MFLDSIQIGCCVIILLIPLVFAYCMCVHMRRQKQEYIEFQAGKEPLINDVENGVKNEFFTNLKDEDVEI
jgi:hypothetical protein